MGAKTELRINCALRLILLPFHEPGGPFQLPLPVFGSHIDIVKVVHIDDFDLGGLALYLATQLHRHPGS